MIDSLWNWIGGGVEGGNFRVERGRQRGGGRGREREREGERGGERLLKSLPNQLWLSGQLSHRQSGSSVGRQTMHTNSSVPAGAGDS